MTTLESGQNMLLVKITRWVMSDLIRIGCDHVWLENKIYPLRNSRSHSTAICFAGFDVAK